MPPVFIPMSDKDAAHYRAGGRDANGQKPERRISDGDGVPCRHSLRLLPKGTPYLIVGHRPFDGLNPYTETGPIFLAAEPTDRAPTSTDLPETMSAPSYIVRGYDDDKRIIYGTGCVVETPLITSHCAALLGRADVAFVHIRSASNNCFTVRVERG